VRKVVVHLSGVEDGCAVPVSQAAATVSAAFLGGGYGGFTVVSRTRRQTGYAGGRTRAASFSAVPALRYLKWRGWLAFRDLNLCCTLPAATRTFLLPRGAPAASLAAPRVRRRDRLLPPFLFCKTTGFPPALWAVLFRTTLKIQRYVCLDVRRLPMFSLLSSHHR